MHYGNMRSEDFQQKTLFKACVWQVNSIPFLQDELGFKPLPYSPHHCYNVAKALL